MTVLVELLKTFGSGIKHALHKNTVHNGSESTFHKLKVTQTLFCDAKSRHKMKMKRREDTTHTHIFPFLATDKETGPRIINHLHPR